MRLPPKSVQQTFPPPNYEHPETRGPALLIVNAILVTLATIALAGRFYSRIFVKFHLGLDDVMIVLAYLFDVGMAVVALLATYEYCWDRHVWDIPSNKIEDDNKLAFATKLVYTGAVTFIRLSFLCFYYRLFKEANTRWFQWALHISLAWTLAISAVLASTSIWLCAPIRAYWIFPPLVPGYGNCWNEGTVMVTTGILSTMTDLLVTILPTPVIMRLHMPLKQRLQICVLLCVGMTATIAGAVRVFYTYKTLIGSWDATWWAYYLYLAGSVEIHLGMICSCAPAWKPLLERPLKQLSGKISAVRSIPSSPLPSPTDEQPFHPLKSLRFFQHTRLGFEKTQTTTWADESTRFKTFSPSLSTMIETSETHGDPYGYGAQGIARPCGITVQRSVDQYSTHIEGDPPSARVSGKVVAGNNAGWF